MPGWDEYVTPLRDKSILWHDIWVECGRPHEGIVASITRTRASNHYTISYVKNKKTKNYKGTIYYCHIRK